MTKAVSIDIKTSVQPKEKILCCCMTKKTWRILCKILGYIFAFIGATILGLFTCLIIYYVFLPVEFLTDSLREPKINVSESVIILISTLVGWLCLIITCFIKEYKNNNLKVCMILLTFAAFGISIFYTIFEVTYGDVKELKKPDSYYFPLRSNFLFCIIGLISESALVVSIVETEVYNEEN